MIRVPRPPKTEPESLRSQRATDERTAAHTHFTSKTNKNAFPFKVYASPDVKPALAKLFNDKCAYCEALLSTQPGDIEHFRPKSEIKEGKQTLRPGYYWLASEWDNLYLSCRDCNGERYQEMVDEYVAPKGGKGNRFPVAPSSRRLKYPNKSKEEPLLLDPCDDDPEEHLSFPTARQGAVVPRKSGADATRAAETIRILGLNRVLLAQARKESLTFLELPLDTLRQYHADARENPNDPKLRARFEDLKKKLRALPTPKRSFSACVRQAIEEAIEELGQI